MVSVHFYRKQLSSLLMLFVIFLTVPSPLSTSSSSSSLSLSLSKTPPLQLAFSLIGFHKLRGGLMRARGDRWRSEARGGDGGGDHRLEPVPWNGRSRRTREGELRSAPAFPRFPPRFAPFRCFLGGVLVRFVGVFARSRGLRVMPVIDVDESIVFYGIIAQSFVREWNWRGFVEIFSCWVA